jgi:predicted membrane protein (TIGR00267 family)
MPSIHPEYHFTSTDTVKDVVIGMSDGLTVPFALAAGLTGAVAMTGIVVTAGLAEIAAGSIAMGLGGYLAARTEHEHYLSEKKREEWECIELPDKEKDEVREILLDFGMTAETAEPVVDALSKNRKRWVDFMMRFELGLEEPDPNRAFKSAAMIAFSYIVGGMIPLSPYMLFSNIHQAVWCSVAVTIVALFAFGMIKGKLTGMKVLMSGAQTALIGGTAAAVAFAIARLIS